MTIAFRPLADDDLPLLHRWLNEPGVVQWWEGDDVSWDGVVAGYAPVNWDRGNEHFVALHDDQPIGWIQCWPAIDDTEEAPPWFKLGVDHSAAGIDYLLGDPESRGQGLGSQMIAAFVRDVVFAPSRTYTQAAAGPYSANEASWRSLAKAGFRQLGIIEDHEGPCTLMVIDRP